ncbi:venom metalloproteinase antarease-like TpachMP_A [Penaeus chinensis]|uniref:venom metalloproteinase antarease-like TpachMP_A n=1 Tax=Penaeus chinensis TaxID=139456 RepID=UPI001FB7C581|nr:venom metalloproteinase antarease-like TpachMP_A [Penaeus chinensis]
MADVESGMIKEGLAGIAWKGAACIVASGNKRSFNTGMGEDMGAYYVGVMTAAHEVAHNLGSPHDGKDGAEACSWDDGYIMSYVSGKSNKLFFSSCSQKLMKDYMSSDDGSCLQTTQIGEKIPLSSQLPGEIVSMDEQCQKQTGKSEAYESKSVSEDSLCPARMPVAGEGWLQHLDLHPVGRTSNCRGFRMQEWWCVYERILPIEIFQGPL